MNAAGRISKRVVVAMSGGVDSAVAAALLARAGYEVVGVTMRLFDAPFENAGRLNSSCCSLEDVQDARDTCRLIGARHYYVNFEKEFRRHVVDYFVSEYERGRTPYPCLACNDRLKFHFLMQRAETFGAGFVATGHYARVSKSADGRSRLLRAADSVKDQSYVLYSLRQEQLSNLLLPIGEFAKPQVRELAHELGLPVADKPDSQDICFIPAGDYRQFVDARLERRVPGRIVDAAGNTLARHDGVHMFTVGQRKGLPPGSSGRPRFVTAIDAASGDVTVGTAEELMRWELHASGVNWISGSAPPPGTAITARIRYRGSEQPATVEPVHGESGRATVRFGSPQRAVTPGQAVVFYTGDEVLGGGYIEPNLPAAHGSPQPEMATAV